MLEVVMIAVFLMFIFAACIYLLKENGDRPLDQHLRIYETLNGPIVLLTDRGVPCWMNKAAKLRFANLTKLATLLKRTKNLVGLETIEDLNAVFALKKTSLQLAEQSFTLLEIYPFDPTVLEHPDHVDLVKILIASFERFEHLMKLGSKKVHFLLDTQNLIVDWKADDARAISYQYMIMIKHLVSAIPDVHKIHIRPVRYARRLVLETHFFLNPETEVRMENLLQFEGVTSAFEQLEERSFELGGVGSMSLEVSPELGRFLNFSLGLDLHVEYAPLSEFNSVA